MNGIKNFMLFLFDNWASIFVYICIVLWLIYKIHIYLQQSINLKIAVAKKQINEIILKLITEAEVDFSEWGKCGNIKRSQVISEIYARYPILSKAKSQKEIINFIDTQINNALKELRWIVEDNIKLGNIK